MNSVDTRKKETPRNRSKGSVVLFFSKCKCVLLKHIKIVLKCPHIRTTVATVHIALSSSRSFGIEGAKSGRVKQRGGGHYASTQSIHHYSEVLWVSCAYYFVLISFSRVLFPKRKTSQQLANRPKIIDIPTSTPELVSNRKS